MSPGHRPIPDEIRAKQFGAYIGTLYAESAATHDWNVRAFCRVAGVSPQTFYRWRRGDWSDGQPTTRKVRAMHEALGVDPARALAIIGASSAPAPDDPLSLAEPEVREAMLAILRRLRDPAESDEERYFMRRTLADLARRPVSSPSENRTTRKRRAG